MGINQEPLLVILGPTATGKTKVAVETALLTGGEIISADSMAVYRYMDIGTAKPRPEERRGVTHHMIDVVTPEQDFSVALFKSMAEEKIKEVRQRGRRPIVAGGTGLFIRALVDGFQFADVGMDTEFRNHMKKLAREKGSRSLHERLQEVDPATAARLHPNDLKRIIRALEIYQQTGQPMSARLQAEPESNCNAVMYGLYLPREELYDRINKRVDRMIARGLVDEVRKLLNAGYDTGLVSMQGLGYKEIASYLQGEVDFNTAVYLLKRNTRRFAKRQLTWFRRDQRINWINLAEYRDPAEIAGEIARKAAGVKAHVSNH